MSWHFSQALVEEFSEDISLAGVPYYGAGCVEYLVREMLKKHYPEAAEVQP